MNINTAEQGRVITSNTYIIQYRNTSEEQKEYKRFLDAVYSFKSLFIQSITKIGVLNKLQEEITSAFQDTARFIYAIYIESFGLGPQGLQINIRGDLPSNLVSNKMKDVYNHFSNLWISILSNFFNDPVLKSLFDYEYHNELTIINLYLQDKPSDTINKIFITAFPVIDISQTWFSRSNEDREAVSYDYRVYFS